MKEKMIVIPGKSSQAVFENLVDSRNDLIAFLEKLGEGNKPFVSITVTQPIFKDSYEPKNHLIRIQIPSIGKVERFREDLNASILNGFPKFKILIELGGPDEKVFSGKDTRISYKFYRLEEDDAAGEPQNVLELEENIFSLNKIDDGTFQQLKEKIECVVKDVAVMVLRVGQIKVRRFKAWEKHYSGQE